MCKKGILHTLQILSSALRQEFLERIYHGLRLNGILILSEKVVCEVNDLNDQFLDSYYRFKKNRGYSELEIAQKREALEDVLIPFSSSDNSKADQLYHVVGLFQCCKTPNFPVQITGIY